MNYLENFLALCLEAAPWLVLGLFIGGLMKSLIPQKFLEKHLKGNGVGSVAKAAVLGAPLPLCSCGVIPAALGLREAGASKPATISFLVATPETGVDSVSVTYAMMGPFMAIVRPIAALMSAMTAGMLVSIFVKEESVAKAAEEKSNTASCCSKKENTDSLSSNTVVSSSAGVLEKAVGGVRYAFGRLYSDIVAWLLIGLLFAAAVTTFVPTDFLTKWGHGLPAMLIMVLAGIPMYVCATASTPIAAGLMLAGVSPGAALVLLLTGPATNVASLGIIGKELGQKAMLFYLLGTIGIALAAGLTVDWIVQSKGIDVMAQLHAEHSGLPMWLSWAAFLLLAVLALRKVFTKPGFVQVTG